MRIHPSVVWLLGCLTLGTWCRPVEAQGFPGGGYGAPQAAGPAYDPMAYGPNLGYPPPPEFGGPPGMQMGYQDPGMMSQQGMGPPPGMMGPGMGPPGMGAAGYYPDDMSTFPTTSPYGPPQSQLRQEDGLWMNQQIFGQRQYFMSLEYLRANLFRPGTDIIGSRTAEVPESIGTFPIDASIIGDGEDVRSDGLRGTFTIRNPDSSGFDANFWWVAEGNQERSPWGKGDPGDFTTLRPRGVIGFDDGTDTGVAVRYDTEFETGYKAQAFGSDLTFRTAPFWETESFRFRMLWGGKYLKVREQFAFHGADSGLDYLLDPVTGLIDPATLLPNPGGNPNFESDMISRTKSDVFGPEIGIQYDIGGKHFLLTGASKFSVAANNEMAWVYGNNMGDGFGTGFPIPTVLDPKPGSFSNKQTHVHVSPVFHQSFGFQGQIFKYVPLMNEWGFFADANLKLGYDFILVGEMVRPTKIIDYRVNNPRIDLSRSRWNTQLFSVGMEWAF